MRTNELKGVVHDLIWQENWQNPVASGFISDSFFKKVICDLKTGEVLPARDDDISKMLKSKAEWFADFVKKKGGDLKDFEKAEIQIIGKKEKVFLIYKGEEFSGENVW